MKKQKNNSVYSTVATVLQLKCAECREIINLGQPCHLVTLLQGFLCTACLAKQKSETTVS